MEGRRVLHLDRNPYYGGDCASLNLSRLFERFSAPGASKFTTNPPTSPDTMTSNAESEKTVYQIDTEKLQKTYGKDRDYNIDVVPKFMMATGGLVEILVHTDVTRYLEFQQIAGSYVYREGSGICKVPSTEAEVLVSSLMGFFEKRRAYKFFEYVRQLVPDDPNTWRERNLMRVSMLELYTEFGLESGTHDFIGHSLALELDEGYLERPALETCRRIKLYMESMLRFGKSPYIYPMYGLGELPQSFARLCAIYGGTFMLDQPVDEILYDNNGKVCGIRSGESKASCKAIIADPSYVDREKLKSDHQVLRVICLMDHPIPNTGKSDSCQIIIPQRQLGRKYDVYIASLSSTHHVCANGFYVTMVSTILEKHYEPNDQEGPLKEVSFAIGLLGPILETFSWVSDVYEPLTQGLDDKLFVSKSYDATSHFETVCEDIRDIYARLTGKPLVIPKRDPVNDQ